MKKTLLNNLKLIAFGMVFAISLSYVHATYWLASDGVYSNPTGTPLATNTALPLNVSTLDQIKQKGSCAPYNCGGISLLGTFVAKLNAEFDGTTFLNGTVGAGTGSLASNSTVRFGGIDPAGNPQSTSIAMSGGLSTNTLFQSGVLVNSAGNRPICSDQNGNVVLCDAPADMCSNIPGTQTTVPANYTQNPDGTCSPKPLRFLTGALTSQVVDIFTSNVVNQVYQDHASQPPGQSNTPLVDQIGLYDSSPSNGNWIYNEIPGVISTTLSNSGTRLINGAGKTGSYHIIISSQGNVGIKGKFGSDTNVIGVDFYMKINSTNWIRLDNATSSIAHEEYPVTGKTTADFGNLFYSNANAFGGNGDGDHYKYVPYNFSYDGTVNLTQGDTVDVYALIYGWSKRGSFFNTGFNNFYYSFEEDNTTFNITAIPSQ